MRNILFRTYEPRWLEVVLHQSRYINHIWPNHPLVAVDYIRITVEEPDYITQDVKKQNVENYYRQEVIPDYPDFYLCAWLPYGQFQFFAQNIILP